MSYYKELLENPSLAYKNQYICTKCVQQPDLQKFVQNSARDSTYCSLCNKHRKVIPLDDFLVHVKDCITEFYDDAANFMPYDSKEGGYMGGSTFDTYDLIYDELLGYESPQLQEILLDFLGADKIWGNIYADDNAAMPLWTSWERFKDITIKQYRYTFLALQMNSQPSRFSATLPSSPKDTLLILRNLIREYNLFTKIPPGTIFYRARLLEKGENSSSIQQLCPPPAELAPARRMNPAGISLFYCSADLDTCLYEKDTPTAQQNRVVAYFKNLRELTVLNLTNLPSLPSIFAENSNERPILKFLHGFAQEISEPVPKDDTQNMQYIPTQILTEYFRYFMTDSHGNKLDGICYRSAKNPSGKNYALFFNRADFKDIESSDSVQTSQNPMFELVDIDRNPPYSHERFFTGFKLT